MLNFKKSPILAFAFVLFACSNHPPVSTSKPNDHYIDASTIDSLHAIPGPPALHTPESDEDFKTLKKYQKTRTKKECARATREIPLRDIFMAFAAPDGPLSEQEVNKWKPFFASIMNEAHPILSGAKDHWTRPRPYLVDKTLHPCVKKEATYAYPSGHAAAGELYAKILSDIYPERKTELMKRGIQIGDDRILGGIHHPTDVRDGRVLADLVYAQLKKSPRFQTELSH